MTPSGPHGHITTPKSMILESLNLLGPSLSMASTTVRCVPQGKRNRVPSQYMVTTLSFLLSSSSELLASGHNASLYVKLETIFQPLRREVGGNK